MTDETEYAFQQPGHNAFRYSSTAFIGVGAVVVFGTLFSLQSDQHIMAIPILLIVLLMVLAIVVIWREMGKPRVRLDDGAIHGYTLKGKKALIAWGETAVVQRPGVASLHLQAANDTPANALIIAIKIANSPEFRAAVEKFAPADHPLRLWMTNEAQGQNPPPYKPSKLPGLIGFGGGIAALYWLTQASGRPIYIKPEKLLYPFVVAFGAAFLVTFIHKQIKGPRWSNQHWLEKIMSAITSLIYSLFMSVIAFDMFMVLKYMK